MQLVCRSGPYPIIHGTAALAAPKKEATIKACQWRYQVSPELLSMRLQNKWLLVLRSTL